MNIKTTIPVSLCGRNTETVMEKNTEANRKGTINIIISNGIPICGKLNARGMIIKIKNDHAAYNEK